MCVCLCKVNGIPLRGETHKEVVEILKELPVCVTMVCCRPAPPMTDTQNDQPQAEDVTTKPTLQVSNKLITESYFPCQDYIRLQNNLCRS